MDVFKHSARTQGKQGVFLETLRDMEIRSGQQGQAIRRQYGAQVKPERTTKCLSSNADA